MRRHLYIVLLFVVIATSVHATVKRANGEFSDQSMARSAQNLAQLIEQRPFTPVGQATLSVLFWDIYHSKLLTSSGQYPTLDENDDLLFQIRYLTDIEKHELVELTAEQWQHIGIEKKRYEVYLKELEALWPDIKKGDQLALLMSNNKSSFYFNNQYVGSITDKDFGQMFIDIWLSEKTSQPSLRKALLGDNNDS